VVRAPGLSVRAEEEPLEEVPEECSSRKFPHRAQSTEERSSRKFPHRATEELVENSTSSGSDE
jgi:hypothetical protein